MVEEYQSGITPQYFLTERKIPTAAGKKRQQRIQRPIIPALPQPPGGAAVRRSTWLNEAALRLGEAALSRALPVTQFGPAIFGPAIGGLMVYVTESRAAFRRPRLAED